MFLYSILNGYGMLRTYVPKKHVLKQFKQLRAWINCKVKGERNRMGGRER